MAQALQAARKVARVIQIPYTSQAHSSLRVRLALILPFVNDLNRVGLTPVLMELTVTLLTLHATVAYLLTLADVLQSGLLVTKVTLRKQHKMFIHIYCNCGG